MKTVLRRPLCPKQLDVTDKLYPCVEELRYVVGSTKCKNIALTGVFGSGKSSVVETFLASDPKVFKKVLKISLSTFLDNRGEAPANPEKYEADIEYKIVQHILYKSDPAKTTQSRFERIAYKSAGGMRLAAALASVAAFCVLLLINPGFLHLDMAGDSARMIIDLGATAFLCYYAVRLLYKGIHYLSCIKVGKVAAKGFEVNFSQNSSVFNKLLDEIVYFFNANAYDLVVFEDLDRLYEPRSLFLKLRELNMLLNESEVFVKAKRTVKFVYAIKDDVFTDEIRTKCFDYIIPVVPVIDRFNASDYLIEHKAELFEDIEDWNIRELGVWINGFRELNNIVNEFNLYKKLVMVPGMSEKKLLAIVIYKNLYPQDYAALHRKEGFLYSVFEKKKVFTDPLIRDNAGKVQTLQSDIASYKEEIRKIKQTYLDYAVREKHVELFYVGEESYSVEEVLNSDYLFDLFHTNAFTRYYFIDRANEESGTLDYDIDFREIEREIGDGTGYSEAVYDSFENIRIDELEVDTLNRKIRSTEQESLQYVFDMLGGGQVRKSLVEIDRVVEGTENAAKVDFVQTMILGGYIVEDYPSYITFYHPGTLKEGDFKFLNSVRQGIQLPFDYKVEDPEEVVGQLSTADFNRDSILNFDILDFLLKEKQKANLLDIFVRTARLDPKFVVAYSKASESPFRFVSAVFAGWDYPIMDIRSTEDEDLRSHLLELFFDASPLDTKISNQELSSIADSYPFIDQHIVNINPDRLKKFLTHYRIRFTTLVAPRSAQQSRLFDYVTDNGHFVIGYENLRVYLGKDFETRAYTAILKNGSKGFYDYVVAKNLAGTLESVPSTSVEEEPEALIKLLNLKGPGEVWLGDYLAKQMIVFETLDGISEKKQHIVLEKDKVIANWNNVLVYFSGHKPLDDVLTGFISRHANELSGAGCEGDPALTAKLQKALFRGNELMPGVYESLLPCFTGEIDYSDLADDLEEDRMWQLIAGKVLAYSAETVEFVNSSYSEDTLALLFVRYFDEMGADAGLEWNLYLSNHIGIAILESELTLEQKKRFIDEYALIDTKSGDASGYAALICSYYVKFGGIDSGTDKDTLLAALNHYRGSGSWQDKIKLINMMNEYYDYDHDTEVAMVNSLGGGYPALNSFYGSAHFDVNDENAELLQYLKDHRHYVSNVYNKTDKNGREQLYVSFLHG